MRPRSAGLLPGSASTRATSCGNWVTTMAPSTKWSLSAACAWRSNPKSSRASGGRFLNLRSYRRDRCHRDVRRDGALKGLPFLDAFEIGLRVVANADAIGDGPLEAGCEQDISARKPVAH